MTLKEKIKSYSFWVSLTSALVLILKVIGSKFGFNIDATLASDIITSLCSILVITGIIVTPTSKAVRDLEILNATNETQKTTEPENTQTNVKDNISILSKTLKETADKILDSTEEVENKKIEEENKEKVFQPSSESKIENCQDKQIVVIESQSTIIEKPIEEVCVEEVASETAGESITQSTDVVSIKEPQISFETQIQVTDDNEFKKLLATQKDKYIKNLDAYIEILSQELNSFKPKD